MLLLLIDIPFSGCVVFIVILFLSLGGLSLACFLLLFGGFSYRGVSLLLPLLCLMLLVLDFLLSFASFRLISIRVCRVRFETLWLYSFIIASLSSSARLSGFV